MRWILMLASLLPAASYAQAFGDCSRPVRAEWLDDGRRMKLLEEYLYTDGRGKAWLAERESVVDGASIPQFLWSFIGGPFEGLYRKASVTHDVECELEREGWRDVHLMFFDAMRCSGVTDARARIMYAAVYHCGPRWGLDQGIRLFPCSDESMTQYVRRFKKLFYDRPEGTLASIESLTPSELAHLDGRSPAERLREALPAGSIREDGRGTIAIVAHFASAELAPDSVSAEALKRVAAILEDMPGLQITVAGHADSTGTSEENQALADLRADRVRDSLVRQGISTDDIRTMSYGEEQPMAPDDTEGGRRQNRRVELLITEGL